MERTLLKTEQREERAAVAAYLRQFAGRLESGETVTLSGGGEDVELDVPDMVELEVAVERDGGETSVEIELEWDGRERGQSGGGLEIS